MINISHGLVRLATSQSKCKTDITLAFISKTETGRFHYPRSSQLFIEAITETSFEIARSKNLHHESIDFLSDWLFELHLIRNPAKAEERLEALLDLLIERLGKRTSEGYKLEFLLPHSRIAEMIGTTRSTVSRTIGAMKRSGKLKINSDQNYLILNE